MQALGRADESGVPLYKEFRTSKDSTKKVKVNKKKQIINDKGKKIKLRDAHELTEEEISEKRFQEFDVRKVKGHENAEATTEANKKKGQTRDAPENANKKQQKIYTPKDGKLDSPELFMALARRPKGMSTKSYNLLCGAITDSVFAKELLKDKHNYETSIAEDEFVKFIDAQNLEGVTKEQARLCFQQLIQATDGGVQKHVSQKYKIIADGKNARTNMDNELLTALQQRKEKKPVV